MRTFKVKIERTYTTYIEVDAENKSEVLSKLDEMSDVVYEQELSQMNVDENVTILYSYPLDYYDSVEKSSY